MSRRGRMGALVALHALEDSEYVESLTFSGREDIEVELEDWDIGRKYLNRPQSLDTTTITEFLSDLRQVEVMDRVFKALAASSSKLLDFCWRTLEPFSSKLSNGLASLPDDLLSLIFKFIVHSDKDGTKLAIRLSHVCRKFRAISLADCTLWSTLTLRSGREHEIARLKTLVSRSGSNTELNIATFMYKETNTLRNAASAFSATASRWRTLFLGFNYLRPGVTISGDVAQIMKEHFLTLPKLEEIEIRAREGCWETSTANFAGIRPWEAPNLRILRFTQYIPPPSFPFTSITTMTLSILLNLGIVRTQVADISSFLSSQSNISDFLLQLGCIDFRSYYPEDRFDPTAIICPAITSFKLVIPWFSSGEWIENARSVAVPILNAFRVPKLENFSVSIKMMEFGRDFTSARTLPELFIPDPDHHPLLTSFTFTALVTGLDNPETMSTELVEFDIPLDKLPRVSTMCVKTFGRFFFTRALEEGQDAASLVELKVLRELQLQSCKHIDEEALGDVVQSLKDVGAWDTLKRVVIRDCELLSYDTALEAVGKERLFFSET